MSAKKLRLNRIFHGRRHGILVVAFDHQLVLGPVPEKEDAAGQFRRLVSAGCDGLLVNMGILRAVRWADCCEATGIKPILL